MVLSHPRAGASWGGFAIGEVSCNNVVETLRLDQLFVVCPGTASYPVTERIGALSVLDCPALKGWLPSIEGLSIEVRLENGRYEGEDP